VGQGIISKPQRYIEEEINYGSLYITAALGSEVVAPVDGIVSDICIVARTSLLEGHYWNINQGKSFDEQIQEIISSGTTIPVPEKYLSGCISIKTNDEKRVWIGGLNGIVRIKTGMTLKKGDVIGNIGYDYKFFTEPNLSLHIRSKNDDILDPMTPFGLPSSFVKPKEMVPPSSLSNIQAQEDLSILFEAYQECYPSLYDRVSPERFLHVKDSCMSLVKDTIDYFSFYHIVRSTTTRQLINDSHLFLLTSIKTDPSSFFVPQLKLGVCGDSLLVTSTTLKQRQYLGKHVVSVNGISEQDIIKRILNYQIRYDGCSIASRCEEMLTAWNYVYGAEVYGMKQQSLVFSDGTAFIDNWIHANTQPRVPILSRDIAYLDRLSQADEQPFSFAHLNDSTLLLTLNTFLLYEADVQTITDSLSYIKKYSNLIIDVRNNEGGEAVAVGKILSLFIEKKVDGLSSYETVLDNKPFSSFSYSMNIPKGSTPFADFIYDSKRRSFCKNDVWTDSIVPVASPFEGKIYILIGENTVSAGTDFASYMVRADRAVTVGRETPTGYHYMTASQFLDLHLPNSGIDIRIPLVKCVFDELVTERTPVDRGLLPDYEVPFTYDEYYYSKEDIILAKALNLIKEGQYLNHPLFSETITTNKISTSVPALISLGAIILIIAISVLSIKICKHKQSVL